MSIQPAIRQAALRYRADLADPAELVPADDLLARALEDCGLAAQALPSGDPLLAGALAVLDRSLRHIWSDASLPATTRRFSIAHEIAHWRLHDGPCQCGEQEIDLEPQETLFPHGEAYIQGYSRQQRREAEANVFAAEFLAPGPALRRAFADRLTPDQIAEQIGIAESTVRSRMAECLLLSDPGIEPTQPSEISSLDRLDDSQRAAATVDSGPTLVVAGPGTGKTRTLIARIEFLIKTGMPSHSILALTFSNRAANEMRERLAQAAPDAARRIWIGTFHAFGLEILRRFGTRIGVPDAPRLLDSMDATALLERRLGDLDLAEYEYLHDPMLPMGDILAAISRAKDELKGPAEYAGLAAAMRTRAESDDQLREAARAEEVARVFARWQQILQEEGLLDFGDLLYRSVELLRACPDVRAQLRAEFPHILVDEYQDVNRASAVLVKELAGDGKGLWLVGDLRQAIYRFRGASPANVGAFESDYPNGRRVTLDVNYRSTPRLVGLFSALAEATGQSTGAGWTSHRTELSSRLVLAEADDDLAQADHIARYVADFRNQGVPYRDQAILCRTNRQAEDLGAALEDRGLPVVYLGDVLARPEVKDLLALISLACEGPNALRRVADFEEYDIPEEEQKGIGDEASSIGTFHALASSDHEGARLLCDHLQPLAFVGDAYALLTRYLFGPAEYLRKLTAENTVQNQQKRLAIHQLLLIARAFSVPEGDDEPPQRAFLAHVRRLLATGETTRAAIPAALQEIDGIRLMTVHAAKGLEFPVIFVPNLCKGRFPPKAQGSMVRLPPGLVTDAGTDADEEDRLFFVALTRARDHLILSLPRSARRSQAEPSPLLVTVLRPLTEADATMERWEAESPSLSLPNNFGLTLEDLPIVPLSDVETYLRCPRQYFYRRVENISDDNRRRPYPLFAEAVRKLIQWHRAECFAGRKPTPDAAAARLEALWNESALADYPVGTAMRRRMEEICAHLDSVQGARSEEWTVHLDHGNVVVRPDGVTEGNEEIVIEKHRLGRESDSHRTEPVLSLYRLAAIQRGYKSVQAVNRYLAAGETKESPPNARYEPARVEKYDRALKGISAGTFDPSPADPNECNRCPFFLVCPH